MAVQPGWYDDPIKPGFVRWWDGAQWTDRFEAKNSSAGDGATVVIPTASEQPAPPAPDDQRPLWRRRLPAWSVVVAGAAAFLVGALIGAVGDSSVQKELEALASERDAAVAEIASLGEENATLGDDNAELLSAVEAARAAETALAQAQADLDARALDIEGREATVAEREAAVQARETAAPVQEVAVEAPSASAHYDNCTTARNAGAAPVRLGDPGYGRHLDRNGDGVGCE